MPATAARAGAPRRAPLGAPQRRPARPPLRAVPAPARRRGRSRGRPTLVVAVVLAVGSLLLVMATHAYLVQGQVGLSKLNQQLTAEETAHRSLEQRVAQLEDPDRIVSQAEHQGLVAPKNTVDLPQVPLAPTTTAPAPTAPAPTAPAPSPGSPAPPAGAAR